MVDRGLRILALAAAMHVALAGPVPAAPVEGRLVVSTTPLVAERLSANLGLEGEVGPRGGFFALGATGWVLGEPGADSGLLRDRYAGTAYVRARAALAAEHELSVLVGHNYRYDRKDCHFTCEPPDSTWLVLGVAWHHQTERYWLRVTPQYELTWNPRFVGGSERGFVGDWTSWALPWLEGGLWLTPTFGLGARIGPGIAQAVWRF